MGVKGYVAVFLAILASLLICVLAMASTEESVVRTTWAWPTYIDPAVGSDYSSSVAFCNLYDPLLMPTADGGMDPWVAESWIVSEDGLKYTFTIRQGITFHDGSELLAEDVAFSVERLLAIGEGYAYLFYGKVESVNALDSTTVELHLLEPFGPLPYALSRLYVVNKDLVLANLEDDGPYGEHGDYGKKFLLTNDAGSGAYVLEEFSVSDHLTALLFPDYWAYVSPRAPERIEMLGTTEAITVRTMMAQRQLDISDQWQTSEGLNALDKMEGVDVASFFDGSEMYLMLNNTKPPLDDVHVRRALAWVLDYDAVANSVFPGSEVAVGPIPQILPGHNEDLMPYRQDLDKAQQELAASSYADTIADYTMEIHWVSEVPDQEKLALLFQSNCAQIGIDIEIVKTPWLTMIDQAALPETTPHIATIIVAPHYAEAGAMLETRYHSDNTGSWEQMEWLQDSTIDSLIDDALGTPDTAIRFQKYRDIQQRLFELAPAVFMIDKVEKHAFQSYLTIPTFTSPIPVMGYVFQFRLMELDLDQKAAAIGN